MYFVLDRSWAMNPARVADRASFDRQGLEWDDGAKFDKAVRTPIEVRLKPLEPLAPDQSPLMPALFKGRFPLYRDDLVAALRACGVDNLDVYDARIIDPDNGQVHTNYKAVNILGLVAAADMGKSQWSAADGIPLIDVAFDRLVIDPAKAMDLLFFRLAENNAAVIVHERVRNHLVQAGFAELEFHRPERVAL
jgi:hypothetical protein